MKKNKQEIQEIQAQQPVEKPKRKVHRKTEEEKAEIAAKAKVKHEQAKEKLLLDKHKKYLEDLEAHFAEEREKLKGDRERAYRKFTCPELIRLFGGWFTLTYAFSVKRMTKTGRKTVEVNTDYYICSQDVSHMKVNERPGLNKIIKKEFDKDVCGFALIAPASAFGEGGAEL